MSEEARRQPLATVAESDVLRLTDCMAAWRDEVHPGPYSHSRLGVGPSMLLRSLSLLDLRAGGAALQGHLASTSGSTLSGELRPL